MVESDLLRNIRRLKEKRDETIAEKGDPIDILERAAESRRKVLIEDNFPKISKPTFEPETCGVPVDGKIEKGKSDRKSRWKEMAAERDLWDLQLRQSKVKEEEMIAENPISAPSEVRKRFEVLTAKEQVERALMRTGKPDAIETPFVSRTAKKLCDLKDLASKGHVTKLDEEKENLPESMNFKKISSDIDDEKEQPIYHIPATTSPRMIPKSVKHETSDRGDDCSPLSSVYSSHATNDSETAQNVSADAMDALTYLNNTIHEFDTFESETATKLESQFCDLTVDEENNGTKSGQKRSVEAEDLDGHREQLVKRRSDQMKSRGSIDDMSLVLVSPQGKVTLDDYRESQRFKEKTKRPTIMSWQNQMTLTNTTYEPTMKRDAKRKAIENQISLLEQQKLQAIKAHKLIMMRSVSTEVEAEAEKCLLVATEKYDALRMINNSMKRTHKSSSKGTIKISDFWVKANRSVIADTEEFRNTWVIGLITVGDEFFPTEMSRMDVQGEVRLKVDGSRGKRGIRNVPPDFELSVSVYSLKISKEKKEKSTSSIFSRSIFSRRSLRKSQSVPAGAGHTNTRFELIGKKTLRIGDVQNITSFKLEKSIMTSIFSATVTSNVRATFTNSMEYCSFLTVKTKGSTGPSMTYGNWTRFWARLKGDAIEFWRYPEQCDSGAPPDGRISLRLLLNREVKNHKRTLRPNTFELYGSAPKPDDLSHIEGVSLDYDHNKFLRYQMSADTSEEKTKWCGALGTVLCELRIWDFKMSPPVDDQY